MVGESYYNAKQAAEQLNLSVAAVLRLCKSGCMFAIKVSNEWFISPESVSMYKRTKSWKSSQNRRNALVRRGGMS